MRQALLSLDSRPLRASISRSRASSRFIATPLASIGLWRAPDSPTNAQRLDVDSEFDAAGPLYQLLPETHTNLIPIDRYSHAHLTCPLYSGLD